MTRTRREYSLLFTERFLDLLGFDRSARIAFHAMGYRWTIDLGTWESEELEALDLRYRELRHGLRDLVAADHEQDDPWGGAEPARIARTCLERMRPVADRLLAAHGQGRIRQDLVHLAWSYSHMHCNRLGVEATPEAILRYFMHRYYQDFDVAAVAR
jgi:hypothetical protein